MIIFYDLHNCDIPSFPYHIELFESLGLIISFIEKRN
jgi:hypothetical protein